MSVAKKAPFHMPVRPYTPIDALNMRAAAVGSPAYAAATEFADYNGHRVGVTWNSYRGYYIAAYFWAGRRVLCRGSLQDCVAAALREYDRGACGASIDVYPRDGDVDGAAWCGEHERLLDDGGGDANWITWRHATAAGCARDYAHPGALVMVFDWELMQACESQAEYIAALRDKHGRVYT